MGYVLTPHPAGHIPDLGVTYSAFAGSFNIDSSVTAGNDQSITGVGFRPKIVLFWWSAI